MPPYKPKPPKTKPIASPKRLGAIKKKKAPTESMGRVTWNQNTKRWS